LPRDVWNELHPTSGEYIRTRDSRLGAGETFHFFWKPSPWNRFVLLHRPDICMPGVGWESSRPPESITIDFSGHQTQLYLFRFRRGDVEALELWGVWRNGDAVVLDYQPDQVLGVAAAPPALHLEGKRRSATEVVACVVGRKRDHPPDADRAITILKSVFQYNSSREGRVVSSSWEATRGACCRWRPRHRGLFILRSIAARRRNEHAPRVRSPDLLAASAKYCSRFPGSECVFAPKARVNLSLGNAPGIRMTVNSSAESAIHSPT